MHPITRLAAAVAALLFLAVAAARAADAPAPAADPANPGFEEAGTRAPEGVLRFPAAGWTSALNNGAGCGEARLSDDAHSGKHAIEMRVLGDDPTKYFLTTTQVLRARPGRKVKLTYFARRKGGTLFGGGYLTFRDAAGKRLKPEANTGYHLGEQWTQYEAQITTPPDADTVEIRFCTFGRVPANGASVQYDDVTLTWDNAAVLENERLLVQVDPECGGRVRSFVLKSPAGNREFVCWRNLRAGGFAESLIPAGKGGSLFYDQPFEVAALEPLRRLKLSHRLKLQGEGLTEFNGLLLEKTLSLKPGASRLDVEVRLVNESGRPLQVPVRERFCLEPAPSTWSWPFTDWLRVLRHQPEDPAADVTTNLARGWIGATWQDGAGLAVVLPGELVERAYSFFSPSIDTLEWYFRPAVLAPGADWRAAYSVCAFQGGGIVFGVDPEVVLTADVGDDTIRTVAAAPVGGAGPATLQVLGRSGTAPAGAAPALAGATATGGTTLEIGAPLAAGVALAAGAGGARLEAGIGGTGSTRVQMETPARLPPAETRGALPAVYSTFFPFWAEADWLYYPEGSGGEPTYRNYMLRLARDVRAHSFNGIWGGRLTEAARLQQLRTPEGANAYAEAARRYGLFLAPSTGLLRKTTEETRKRFWEPAKARGYIFEPEVRDFFRRYKDRIAFFEMSDEPPPMMVGEMLKVIAALKQELPADIAFAPVLNLSAHQFAPYVPIYCGDHYPIHSPAYGDRNPWDVGPAVREAVRRAGAAPVWGVAPGVGAGGHYQLPPGEEMRLMLYAAVANGARGIIFHGFGRLSWRYKYWYDFPIYDNAGATTPAFDAAVEVARQVTAVGPALLDAVPEENPQGVNVAGPAMAGKFYKGEVLRVTSLKRRRGEGRFLCVQNQDLAGPRKGALSVSGGPVLLDLMNMRRLRPGVAVPIELAAGDMGIYFHGPAAEGEAVWQSVFAQRARNEADRFLIDADRARANGVKVDAAQKLVEQARQAADAGAGEKASVLMKQARESLDAALKPTRLPACLAALAQARAELSRTAARFREERAVLVPPALYEATPSNGRFANAADPPLQAAVDAIAEDWQTFWSLERALWEGRGDAVSADVLALPAKVSEHAGKARELIAERKARGR